VCLICDDRNHDGCSLGRANYTEGEPHCASGRGLRREALPNRCNAAASKAQAAESPA
jgi:hypothetical protein